MSTSNSRTVFLSLALLSTTASTAALTPPMLSTPPDGAEVSNLRPDLSVLNFIDCDTSSVGATSGWTVFAGTQCLLNGEPMPVGSVVRAWDPDGVLCGERIVTTPGIYIATSVYGDDPVSAVDEGCVEGDTVRFTIDCQPAVSLGPDDLIWRGPGPLKIVNLSATQDLVSYHFEISQDSLFGSISSFEVLRQPGITTTLLVDYDLSENDQYWWRVYAHLDDDTSEYSPPWSFYVNSHNSAPTLFDLLLPQNSITTPIATLTPQFLWQASFDPDPLDTIFYEFYLSADSLINFIEIRPYILAPFCYPSDPLEWGRVYFWMVQATDARGGYTWSNGVFNLRTMLPGDADASGRIDLTDAVYLVNYIFAHGAPPNPLESGDPNCDGRINITDAVYLVNYIFSGGAPPCAA